MNMFGSGEIGEREGNELGEGGVLGSLSGVLC